MTKSGPLRHLEQLLSIRDEWEDLHERSSEKSPLLSFEFVRRWYECFADPGQVRIYRASDGGDTIGFLPLVSLRESGIRVLGSLTNEHCFHSEPLVREGSEETFPPLLLREVLGDGDGWDLFRHRFSYSFSNFPGLFSDELLDRCGVPWQRKRQPTYTVLIRRPFEEYYLGDLTRAFRKTLRKSRNRLEKEGEIRFRNCEGAEALERWPEFVRIEGSGWKGREGSSIHRTARNFRRYYQGLVELLAARGALRLFFLEVDNRSVAGEFGYFAGGTFHAFKTGYDERIKHCSPGNLLLMHVIEEFSRNCPEAVRLHLFPWGHDYKHRYVNQPAHCIETRIYSRTPRGRASYLLSRAKDLVGRAVRKPRWGETWA
jgi:CelD/BcsL family acetyltransferase involved in cellulose biosynthesis